MARRDNVNHKLRHAGIRAEIRLQLGLSMRSYTLQGTRKTRLVLCTSTVQNIFIYGACEAAS